MRKIIAAILALSMLLCITACKAEEKEMKTDIVGDWISVSVNASAVFYEDGTGELSYNGKRSVTWKYDPDTDRYIVTGDQTFNVHVGKEYTMPYMSLDGVDFYHPEDYGNAYTLLLSKRFEDITNLTAEMTKIELNTSCNLVNAVSISFVEISRYDDDNDDGLTIAYTIYNDRAENVSEALAIEVQGRFYLANQQDAVTQKQNVELLTNIAPGDMVMGTFNVTLGADTQATIDAHATVIGILYFEIYGQKYYIDLTDYFKK